MAEQTPGYRSLERLVRGMDAVAVAVSGGVDSLTLATFAHRLLRERCEAFHATSPAVPPEATRRTRALADREGWTLHVVDAHEFGNDDYRSNPVDRCFHCKTSLYGTITPHTRAQVVSGTNTDDLGEYRPGLIAAERHGVRHPFVEAGMGKREVRALARTLGLGAIAELPSAPCLSSRIETGIAIDPAVLSLVHRVERLVARAVRPATVRCRVRAAGVAVELDDATLARLPDAQRDALCERVRRVFAAIGDTRPVVLAPYRVGSAFLHAERDVITPR
jgi:uncharacterized protein